MSDCNSPYSAEQANQMWRQHTRAGPGADSSTPDPISGCYPAAATTPAATSVENEATMAAASAVSASESQTSYVQMEEARVNFDHTTKRHKSQNGGTSEDEDDASVTTYAESILSSVMTAEGISDKRGFVIVCFVVLIGDMSRGVMFPTLWPLVESLGGSTVTLGYAVSAFSFGRVLVSPLFGSWSVTHGYMSTLLISCSILLLGSFLYAQVPLVGRAEYLVIAQTILGMGSGTLGVTRAYVAEVTPQRSRTTYIAWLSAVEYLGFAGTPFIGSLFAAYFDGNEDRVVNTGWFLLNSYTAPGWFLVLMVTITLILLITCFQDRRRQAVAKKKKSKRRQAIDALANSMTIFPRLNTYNMCILGCMLLNVATKGSISSFETMGITLAEASFAIEHGQAGMIVGTCGFLGVVSLLCMGKISRFLTDVQMIIGGMIVMILGIGSLTGVVEGDENSPWIYVVAIFMIYSIGYSIGHAAVIGLFSKIVGRQPQGTLLGWFSVAGSLARMFFPLISGYVMHYRSIGTLCFILIGVLGAAIAFVGINRNTLVKLST